MKYSFTLTFSLILFLNASPSDCSAAMIYGTAAEFTGTRSAVANELIINEFMGVTWFDGIIEWSVLDAGGGLFDYTYIFYNFDSPAISHFTLDVTDDVVTGDALNDPNAITNARLNNVLIDVIEFGNKDGITGAVKFEASAETNPVVYTFTSNRAPVWGDVYLKGGNGATATNLAFGDQTSMNTIDYIARPNGNGHNPVPEPSSLLLGLLSLGGIIVLRKKTSEQAPSELN